MKTVLDVVEELERIAKILDRLPANRDFTFQGTAIDPDELESVLNRYRDILLALPIKR